MHTATVQGQKDNINNSGSILIVIACVVYQYYRVASVTGFGVESGDNFVCMEVIKFVIVDHQHHVDIQKHTQIAIIVDFCSFRKDRGTGLTD